MRTGSYFSLGSATGLFYLYFMPSKRVRKLWIFATLISFAIAMCIMAFDAGLAATSWVTKDSMGHAMGFNDPFSDEHYGIILSNCSVSSMVRRMDFYDWLFAGFHFLVIGLVLLESKLKWTLRICLLQPLIFPLGFFGFFVVPAYTVGIAQNSLHRESFTDVPVILVIAHFIWISVAMMMAWQIYRSRSSVKLATAREDMTNSLAWS